MRSSLMLLGFVLCFTSLLRADEAPWRFIIVGDSRSDSASDNNGVNVPVLSEIAAEIVTQNPDFVLFPGDLVLGSTNQTTLQGQLTTWRNCMQPVYDAGIGVYVVRGNHDDDSIAAWNAVFSGAYAMPQNGPAGEVNLTYSFLHKNAFILGLDTYVNSMRVNQPWIDAQLAAQSQPHVFAFGHVPAFRVDHADCLDDYESQRNALWISLRNKNCRIYACGHDHFYDHALIDDPDSNPYNNIYQCLVGTAGAPLRGWDPPYIGLNSGANIIQVHHRERFGYVLVDVLNDTDIRTTWYERDEAAAQYKPILGSVDLQFNFLVNIGDLMRLAEEWLRADCLIGNAYCGGADVNRSLSVDWEDAGVFSREWLKTYPIARDFQISASADDAEENASSGAVSLTSTDLELITDSAAQVVGLRFAYVPVPPGAQIADAYIQFACDEPVNANPCSLMIYAQNIDNAPAFTTAAYNVSSRAKTAGIAWNPPDWPATVMGIDQRTPNLASILQAVVSRPGWQSGNALVFIISGSGKRVAEAWDDVPSLAPILHIQLQ